VVLQFVMFVTVPRNFLSANIAHDKRVVQPIMLLVKCNRLQHLVAALALDIFIYGHPLLAYAGNPRWSM